MLKLENKEIQALHINGYPVLSIYMLGQLIWPPETDKTILSCYSNGYWIDEYPWIDDNTWLD